jgi:hypothetical protein
LEHGAFCENFRSWGTRAKIWFWRKTREILSFGQGTAKWLSPEGAAQGADCGLNRAGPLNILERGAFCAKFMCWRKFAINQVLAKNSRNLRILLKFREIEVFAKTAGKEAWGGQRAGKALWRSGGLFCFFSAILACWQKF